MCWWNTDALAATTSNMAKSLSPTFWPFPILRGHAMSVKCEQSSDELRVQVFLLYYHQFSFLNIVLSCKRDWITDKQTDGRTNRPTDDPIPRCPDRPIRPWALKSIDLPILEQIWKKIINNKIFTSSIFQYPCVSLHMHVTLFKHLFSVLIFIMECSVLSWKDKMVRSRIVSFKAMSHWY